MAQRKLDDARVALALFEPLALAWYKANKGEVDLHDVVTHREAWRKALSIAQATALPPGTRP
jgi:hypothetical protein